jgi:hypothetical protein
MRRWLETSIFVIKVKKLSLISVKYMRFATHKIEKKKFSFVSDQGNVKTLQNLSNATPITKDEDHPEVYFKISIFHDILVRFSFISFGRLFFECTEQ